METFFSPWQDQQLLFFLLTDKPTNTHCYPFISSCWSQTSTVSAGMRLIWFLLPPFFLSSVTTQLLPPPSLPFRSPLLLPLPVLLHLLCVAVTVSQGGAVRHVFASFLRWRFASVRVVVEVGEEDDEGDGVANQSPLHPAGERTAGVEGVASMADGHVELDLFNKKA